MRRSPVAAVVLAVALSSCSDKKAAPSASTQPSPNASILPAPLASAAEPATAAPARSTPTPTAAPSDSTGRPVAGLEPPAPEAPPLDGPLPADTLTAKDGVGGYTVSAAFRWADVPGALASPELSVSAVRDAVAKTELRVTVDLATVGRMRFLLESGAFPLPAHTELRARTSYHGHVVVWPDGAAYRVLAPGALRSLFEERRADVAPLLRAHAGPESSGTLLGHKTVRTDIETSIGTLSLEQAVVLGSGDGGELFCRLLVELVGAEPTTDACRPDRVALLARYRWSAGGSISLLVSSLVERKELPLASLYVPPPGAASKVGELPPGRSGLLLGREDLTKFRTRVLRGGTPRPHAPAEGLMASNETNLLQYLLVDGAPVAWIRPKGQEHVVGLLAGRYSVAWRDFFGTETTAPVSIEVPAFASVGTAEPDAGARL